MAYSKRSELWRRTWPGLLAGIAALALGVQCKEAAKPLQGAAVLRVSGQLSATEADGQTRSIGPAELNTRAALIFPGTSLRLDAGASADLGFANGAVLALRECSRLKLEQAQVILERGDTRIAIDLQAGSAFTRSAALSAGSEYSVRTPTAVAAVRGTQFLVRHGDCRGGNRSDILVREGSVAVAPPQGAELAVGAGERASSDGRAIQSGKLSAAESEELSTLNDGLADFSAEARQKLNELLRGFQRNDALYDAALRSPAPAARPQSEPTAPAAPAESRPSPAPAPAAEPAAPAPTPAPAPAPEQEKRREGEGADSAPLI